MGVIGLYTCSCHLFSSYDEAKKEMLKKLKLHTEVKNRCTGMVGTVIEIYDRGYVLIKYGQFPKDNHLEHSQELLIHSNQLAFKI